ncbi:MAG: gliding motility-associated C-terminal domain-containing protein [Saprospiraceae bacterium]|uniref:T9SS type B sorting domain-containing protein n=1 Tax=Candidatus Brachybacter algidus TaxID=2982024 RepID=UPI00257B1823|nr:T9SS type B sorting domain-containing protein [Candidatus Brachybacter algidus]MBK7605654.1 gliding motility-associated C-terminal domain-containing protein [Candidatus Brachybacter algidus]
MVRPNINRSGSRFRKDVYSAEMVSPTEMFCSGDGSIEIVGIIPKLIMPNAFTPNNDGVNDRFRAVIDPGVEIVKLTVVSRWGQTMYSEAGNDGWDGKYSGKDAPSDTYIYSISYRFLARKNSSHKREKHYF